MGNEEILLPREDCRSRALVGECVQRIIKGPSDYSQGQMAVTAAILTTYFLTHWEVHSLTIASLKAR